jgi:hypothetical protein
MKELCYVLGVFQRLTLGAPRESERLLRLSTHYRHIGALKILENPVVYNRLAVTRRRRSYNKPLLRP